MQFLAGRKLISPGLRPEYKVTLARTNDLPLLPAIELAAETLFAGHGLDSVPSLTTSLEDFREAQRHGHLWVRRICSS
jgi:hypothetical protein